MPNHKHPEGVKKKQHLSQILQGPVSKSKQTTSSIAMRFMIVAAISVFVAEAIMVFLNVVGPFGLLATVLLHALLILVCTVPALYVWLYRPMLRQISERIGAEEYVRESERRLFSHLQNTPIAAIEWNLGFEVVEWNAAAEGVFGYTKDEALGRHAAGLLVPESAKEHVNQVWNGLLENTGGLHSTNENVTNDGRTIVCEWNNTPLADESGRVFGVASLVQDITERKRAEDRMEGLGRLREELLAPGSLIEKMRHITNGVIDIFGADFARVWLTKEGDLCDSGCVHASATEGPHVCRHRDCCLHLMASSGRYTHIDGKTHQRVPFGCYKIGLVAAGKDAGFL
ncbi:MAG: PAS domain S-box protein, partial [candidate division Zixibacteria bacterium]